MKGKRYTEEQIIPILNEVESGKAVKEVCREQWRPSLTRSLSAKAM